MRFLIAAISFLMLLATALPAEAGQAEVRNVALLNNCTPKKIDVYQQTLGIDGATIYQVQCTLPKAVGTPDKDAKTPDALLVSCTMNLCEMLRPLTLDKK